MTIFVESTSTKILVSLKGSDGPFVLQRAFYKDRTWLTYTENGFVILDDESELLPKPLDTGDFVDSFDLKDGLYEYRIVPSSKENPEGNDYKYSEWIKFGTPDAIGYSFNNYHSPDGEWGTAVTPDDCRYTFLWGTDFKATNGAYFSDEQIQWFIDAATSEMERLLNITLKKKVIKSQLSITGLKKGVDYDEEEALYDYTQRKIQRYGMIQTKSRPIIDITRCELINRGETSNMDLMDSIVPDKKQGVIKFLKRPFNADNTHKLISNSLCRYGSETFQPHLFYAVDYSAGYESSDELPKDLRQMIGKVAAISLLNIIGDGLMSGFSSSSLSMDGISESFSSTQSATSAYFGARIKVYQDEVKDYIEKNKFRFGYYPIGCL